MTRTGPRDTSGRSASNNLEPDVHQRAAGAYIVWPLAVLDYVREPVDATAWSRLHTRQALVFGIVATFAYLVVLALPLLIVLVVPVPSTTLVVWLYVIGLLADIVVAALLFARAFHYRARALRGELFSIPFVTPIADRLLRGADR